MIRLIKHMFAWRKYRDTGVWAYYENSISGRRKAIKVGGRHQPLDFRWLSGGSGDGVAYGNDKTVVIPWGSHRFFEPPSPPLSRPPR